jgi:hypothetical protein
MAGDLVLSLSSVNELVSKRARPPPAREASFLLITVFCVTRVDVFYK